MLWVLIRIVSQAESILMSTHNIGFYEEAILIITHNIGFYEDLTKIIFQLSSNTHLISSSGLPSLNLSNEHKNHGNIFSYNNGTWNSAKFKQQNKRAYN